MESSPATDPYAAPKAAIASPGLPPLPARSRVARACLYLHYPLIVIGIVFSAVTYARTRSIDSEQFGSATVLIGVVFGCVAPFIYLATVVTFFVWLHTAYVRATADVADARFTPAASVGWWFVPFANLWQPLETMRHLWQLSHSGADWHRVTPPQRVAVWWLALVSCIALNCAVVAMVWVPGVMLARRILGFVAPTLALVAVFLAARIVAEITALQRDRLGID